MTDEQRDREAMLQSMARTEEKVENLVTSFRDLKRSVEELVDRVSEDVDSLRSKFNDVGVLQVTQIEHARRLGQVEADIRTKADAAVVSGLATKVDSINSKVLFASGGVAVISVLVSHFWK